MISDSIFYILYRSIYYLPVAILPTLFPHDRTTDQGALLFHAAESCHWAIVAPECVKVSSRTACVLVGANHLLTRTPVLFHNILCPSSPRFKLHHPIMHHRQPLLINSGNLQDHRAALIQRYRLTFSSSLCTAPYVHTLCTVLDRLSSAAPWMHNRRKGTVSTGPRDLAGSQHRWSGSVGRWELGRLRETCLIS